MECKMECTVQIINTTKSKCYLFKFSNKKNVYSVACLNNIVRVLLKTLKVFMFMQHVQVGFHNNEKKCFCYLARMNVMYVPSSDNRLTMKFSYIQLNEIN